MTVAAVGNHSRSAVVHEKDGIVWTGLDRLDCEGVCQQDGMRAMICRRWSTMVRSKPDLRWCEWFLDQETCIVACADSSLGTWWPGWLASRSVVPSLPVRVWVGLQ